jgi:ATP-binding cassette subfamily F protein 1
MIDQDIQIESSDQKISEFILGADPILWEGKKRMDELEKIEEMGDIESDEYNRLSELVYSREWDKYVAESKRIIDGLGFENHNLPVSILSGGKRMILAIAKALLRKPDILMLDEPTNHLDLDVVIWLTNYLSTYKKTLIVITHQIGLVNSLADVIWFVGNPELTGNKVYTIRGKYDKLLKFLDQTEKETNKNYEKFTKKVEELRKKSTPKKDVDEFIKKECVQRPPKPYIVNMTFDNVVELSTKNIIEFKDVGFGYSNDKDKSQSKPIYSRLNISLDMGSRMILVGPNGCGKTTFFKLINGLIKPTEGYIVTDDRLRVGYYNQQIVDNLPLQLNPIQYLQQLSPKLDSGQCRNILGKLGIKKTDTLDLPTNKIADLSGGQKARVSFASVQMLNPHLILLDEPTNHLDLESIEGLIKGINEFNGGIVVITHDIYLIESIERAGIFQVSNSNIVKFPGEFEDYCEIIYSTHEH